MKMRRNLCGTFICHKIKTVTEINISEQNKKVAGTTFAKEMSSESVLNPNLYGGGANLPPQAIFLLQLKNGWC